MDNLAWSGDRMEDGGKKGFYKWHNSFLFLIILFCHVLQMDSLDWEWNLFCFGRKENLLLITSLIKTMLKQYFHWKKLFSCEKKQLKKQSVVWGFHVMSYFHLSWNLNVRPQYIFIIFCNVPSVWYSCLSPILCNVQSVWCSYLYPVQCTSPISI